MNEGMRYVEVAENAKALLKDAPDSESFIYNFLLAYGTPRSSVVRLRTGDMNLAKVPGDLLFKKKLFFKAAEGDLFTALESLKSAKGKLMIACSPEYPERFACVKFVIPAGRW